MKNKVYIIIISIIVVIIAIGTTLALVYYRSDATSVNLTFDANLGSFINYESGDPVLGGEGVTLNPTTSYTGGISTEIEFWKSPDARNMDIFGHIFLDISSGSNALFNMKALRWTVTSNDVMISEGDFAGYSQGDSVPILVNQKLLTTLTKFKIYIWLDENKIGMDAVGGEILTLFARCEATSGEYDGVGVDVRLPATNFDFIDDTIQEINLDSGKYFLEVWGAQGGSSSVYTDARGGYGGYSSGYINLYTDTVLYVVVGGAGINGVNTNATKYGGYNGGGDKVSPDSYHYSSSGGGATHIALSSGLLSSFENDLENKLNDIIIVAGGGGGGAGVSGNYGVGGSGGGYIGSDGTNIMNNVGWGAGGSQTSGGCKSNLTTYCGSFGLGNSTSKGHGGAGGGGFYGGGSTNADNIGGGGGGSGYIGNSLLTDKVMYCYECQDSSNEDDETNIKTISTNNVSDEAISNYAKKGNGYARITKIGKNINILSRKAIAYGSDYDFKEMIISEIPSDYIVVYSSYDNANTLSIGEYQILYIVEDTYGNEYTYYQKIEIIGG